MAGLQPVRGTRDILPEESRQLRHVADTARHMASRFGFEEVATPIFEFSDVFKRTLGDTSDIVTKEMYSFTDKGGDEVTLRPEGTAGIARMLISGGLAQNLPLKYFYQGPMFRYERPQKGRYRQFHQIGVELLGVAEPVGDVEIIALGAALLEALGLSGNTRLELNTLGNNASRTAYRDRLVTYLEDHRDALSEDSQARLARNPLRILDSKNKGTGRLLSARRNFPTVWMRNRRIFSRRSAMVWVLLASPIHLTHVSYGGSIITATRHLNSPPRPLAHRVPCWPGAAMTGWCLSWGARRHLV